MLHGDSPPHYFETIDYGDMSDTPIEVPPVLVSSKYLFTSIRSWSFLLGANYVLVIFMYASHAKSLALCNIILHLTKMLLYINKSNFSRVFSTLIFELQFFVHPLIIILYN